MGQQEREAILKDNIDNAGIALFETAMAWFWSDRRVSKHVTIEGMEHIEALEKQGKGVLMLAVHSMNLELGARAFGIKNQALGFTDQTTTHVLITFNTKDVLVRIEL